MPLVEVILTEQGYLQFTLDIAQRCFPSDAMVVTKEEDALMFWPVRGAEGGGLLVKQRNAMGGRSVLIAEMLPHGSIPGEKIAEWDEVRGVLRLSLEELKTHTHAWRVPKDGVGVAGVVEEENGRWVVYLEVGSWQESAPNEPLRMQRHRIADYPTAEKARIAAEWMQRSADRSPSVKSL